MGRKNYIDFEINQEIYTDPNTRLENKKNSPIRFGSLTNECSLSISSFQILIPHCDAFLSIGWINASKIRRIQKSLGRGVGNAYEIGLETFTRGKGNEKK